MNDSEIFIGFLKHGGNIEFEDIYKIMEKEREKKYRIICIKPPKWLRTIFRLFRRKDKEEG